MLLTKEMPSSKENHHELHVGRLCQQHCQPVSKGQATRMKFPPHMNVVGKLKTSKHLEVIDLVFLVSLMLPCLSHVQTDTAFSL